VPQKKRGYTSKPTIKKREGGGVSYKKINKKKKKKKKKKIKKKKIRMKKRTNNRGIYPMERDGVRNKHKQKSLGRLKDRDI